MLINKIYPSNQEEKKYKKLLSESDNTSWLFLTSLFRGCLALRKINLQNCSYKDLCKKAAKYEMQYRTTSSMKALKKLNKTTDEIVRRVISTIKRNEKKIDNKHIYSTMQYSLESKFFKKFTNTSWKKLVLDKKGFNPTQKYYHSCLFATECANKIMHLLYNRLNGTWSQTQQNTWLQQLQNQQREMIRPLHERLLQNSQQIDYLQQQIDQLQMDQLPNQNENTNSILFLKN